MPTIDETVAVLRDDEWQYVRVPLSVHLPEAELQLHRDTPNGPITLYEPNSTASRIRKAERLEQIFREIDEALADGETLELERAFCPPRDLDL